MTHSYKEKRFRIYDDAAIMIVLFLEKVLVLIVARLQNSRQRDLTIDNYDAENEIDLTGGATEMLRGSKVRTFD